MINQENMLNALKEATSVLDNHIGSYWLDSGTLLGIIRDKQFLPWDNDLDIGVWGNLINTSVRNNIIKSMKKNKFTGYFKSDKALFIKDGIRIEILFWNKVNDMATRTRIIPNNRLTKYLSRRASLLGMSTNPFSHSIFNMVIWIVKILGVDKMNLVIPQKYVLTTEKKLFNGLTVKIPKNPEDYLMFRYGSNWKTPTKNWDTWSEDGWILEAK